MKYFLCHEINEKFIFLNLFKFNNGKVQFLKNITKSHLFNYQQAIKTMWIDDNKFIFNNKIFIFNIKL